MKRFTLTILIGLIGAMIFFLPWQAGAQAPQAINYQAVVRNSSGDLITNQQVSFRIGIVKESINGTLAYCETHNKTTNQFGLVSLKIGTGIIESGSFEDINWSTSNYFTRVEFDETGNANYRLMGTSQIMSVPYALYSENAGSVENTNSVIISSGTDLNNNGEIIFETSENRKVTITNDGDMGIGTKSPAGKLDVDGSLCISGDCINSWEDVRIENVLGVAAFIVFSDSGNGLFVHENNNLSIQFMDNGTYRLNFTTPMPDNNYLVTGMCNYDGNAAMDITQTEGHTPSEFYIACMHGSDGQRRCGDYTSIIVYHSNFASKYSGNITNNKEQYTGSNVDVNITNPCNKNTITSLPIYADNNEAIKGGLIAGDLYRTEIGVLMVVF